MNDYNSAELNSAHRVKVLICYLLDRLKQPVTEEQLYEIAVESGVVNYFYYAEALEGLLQNRSLIRAERNGKPISSLPKRRAWARTFLTRPFRCISARRY